MSIKKIILEINNKNTLLMLTKKLLLISIWKITMTYNNKKKNFNEYNQKIITINFNIKEISQTRVNFHRSQLYNIPIEVFK